MKTTVSLEREDALYQDGYEWVGGVDEAGRGPLAGPVVACAVVLPRGLLIEGVNDSKKLTPKRRETLAAVIQVNAVAYGIGIVDAATIDRINILQATFSAMAQAVDALSITPGALLIDGPYAPPLSKSIFCLCLPHGDAISHSIAAASILAKVTRDKIMDELHLQYPVYGFNTHKGYGTRVHTEALRKHGPCPQHRLSFKTV